MINLKLFSQNSGLFKNEHKLTNTRITRTKKKKVFAQKTVLYFKGLSGTCKYVSDMFLTVKICFNKKL